jgi:hypothetical protein
VRERTLLDAEAADLKVGAMAQQSIEDPTEAAQLG